MIKNVFKKVLELITDHNGTLSHTKLWSNVANLAGTIAFVYYAFNNKLEAEVLIAYIATIGLQRVTSKFLDNKDVQVKDKKI